MKTQSLQCTQHNLACKVSMFLTKATRKQNIRWLRHSAVVMQSTLSSYTVINIVFQWLNCLIIHFIIYTVQISIGWFGGQHQSSSSSKTISSMLSTSQSSSTSHSSSSGVLSVSHDDDDADDDDASKTSLVKTSQTCISTMPNSIITKNNLCRLSKTNII